MNFFQNGILGVMTPRVNRSTKNIWNKLYWRSKFAKFYLMAPLISMNASNHLLMPAFAEGFQPISLELALVGDEVVENECLIIDFSLPVKPCKIFPRNGFDGLALPVGKSHPVKEVKAVGPLQVLDKLHRSIDGTATCSSLAFIYHEDDELLVKYLAKSPQLKVVADPLPGELVQLCLNGRKVFFVKRLAALINPNPCRFG